MTEHWCIVDKNSIISKLISNTNMTHLSSVTAFSKDPQWWLKFSAAAPLSVNPAPSVSEFPAEFPGLWALDNLQSAPAPEPSFEFLSHATGFLRSLSTSARDFRMLIPSNWRNLTLRPERDPHYWVIWPEHMTRTHGLVYLALKARLVWVVALHKG